MRVAVFPGSFDPITNGHIDVLKKALASFDKVIMLVADNEAKKARFTTEQRVEMVEGSVKDLKGVSVGFTHGLTVDFAKKAGTHYLIRGIRNDTDMVYENKYADLTHLLDSSIEFVYIKASEQYSNISSSKIHEMGKAHKDISDLVPDSVVQMYKKSSF